MTIDYVCNSASDSRSGILGSLWKECLRKGMENLVQTSRPLGKERISDLPHVKVKCRQLDTQSKTLNPILL